METITKRDLARVLCERKGFREVFARQMVDALVQALTEAITRGERIEIRGLGVWDVKTARAKPNARNPRTGVRVRIPARRKVLFKPGKALKEVLSRPIE